MIKMNKRKELRVFVNSERGIQQISRWIFLEKLGLCFRITEGNGGWQNIEYGRALEICKRIVSRADGEKVRVSGSIVDELQREEMVSKLFSEGKLVLEVFSK